MTDYTREIELVRRLDAVANKLQVLQLSAAPIVGLAAMFGQLPEAAVNGLMAISRSCENSMRVALMVWQIRYGVFAGASQRSANVRRIAMEFPVIGKLYAWGTERVFYDVCGIPVAVEPHDRSEYFYAPASAEAILGALSKTGCRWVIDPKGNLSRDTAMVPSVMASQTVEIIDRIRPHTTCRAWALWGPPRGGKSVAARQIADAIAGGWVRLCGSSSRSQDAWDTAMALQAKAVILDDLDCNAGLEDDLLGLIERARDHCRVIISTMNVLPKSDTSEPQSTPGSGKPVVNDRKRHELRGAILAPGRAADERPRQYTTLDESVRRELAPNVPEALRAPDLLAAYLVELETRQRAYGGVTQADLDEMRERMAAVGER